MRWEVRGTLFETSGETIVICPNCGEDNSSNFKFCGMCGTSLEERRPLGAPRVVSASDAARSIRTETEARTPARTPVTAEPVLPTTGPSFLGLSEPYDGGDNRSAGGNGSREQSFFGSETFFEPEESSGGARRIFVLLVLLAALGAGGWWAYSHYNKIGAGVATSSQVPANKPDNSETAANSAASNPAPASAPAAKSSETSSSSDGNASQPGATTAAPSAQAPVQTTPAPKVEEKATPTPPPVAKPAEPSARAQHVVSARHDARAAKSAPARPASATSVDKGDAEFRRGEAYLYGRGVPENCDQAVKNLKAASAKQNAQARSAFGTMYATGHCVPRESADILFVVCAGAAGGSE